MFCSTIVCRMVLLSQKGVASFSSPWWRAPGDTSRRRLPLSRPPPNSRVVPPSRTTLKCIPPVSEYQNRAAASLAMVSQVIRRAVKTYSLPLPPPPPPLPPGISMGTVHCTHTFREKILISRENAALGRCDIIYSGINIPPFQSSKTKRR